jgi:hypothetical protein
MAAVEKKRKEGGDVMGTMTLRDYFAAKAMQAYLNGHDRDSFTYTDWAFASYQMADAMLKAREA